MSPPDGRRASTDEIGSRTDIYPAGQATSPTWSLPEMTRTDAGIMCLIVNCQQPDSNTVLPSHNTVEDATSVNRMVIE